VRVLVPATRKPSGDFIASPHFGGATHLLVIDVEGDSCKIVEVVELLGEGRARTAVDTALAYGANALLAKWIGYRPYTALRRVGVRVYELKDLDPCKAALAVKQGNAAELAGPRPLHRGRGHH
jgi:predicted Fe-Mo cluster-binding NifX family protein